MDRGGVSTGDIIGTVSAWYIRRAVSLRDIRRAINTWYIVQCSLMVVPGYIIAMCA